MPGLIEVYDWFVHPSVSIDLLILDSICSDRRFRIRSVIVEIEFMYMDLNRFLDLY